jgi:hypothetical protein
MRCRSSDPPQPRVRSRAAHGPRHAATSEGASCGGKNSGRSRGSLAVHCCPPRPSDASPRLGPRGPSTGPRAETSVPTCATLLTLAPTFPTRSGPCDPACQPGFLSWGCPKIAPPSCAAEESELPEVSSVTSPPHPRPAFPRGPAHRDPNPHRCGTAPQRPPPSGWERQFPSVVPPSWFLTTSTVFSSSTLRPFSGRCRSWGSRCFRLSRNRPPHRAPSALRSFPSADSYGRRDESRPSAGLRHRADRLRPPRSPHALPPRPSARAGDLEALLHRRVRCALGRFQPTAPGAPLGLTNLRVPASLPRRRPRER